MLQTIPAFSQEAGGTNAGEDFFRPPTNLFQLITTYRTAPANGSNGTVTNVTTGTLDFRYDHAIDLAPMWILALRSDLPVLAKNPFSSDNPDRNYLLGVGDADVQAVLVHNLSQRLAVGFGARLITPTGGDTFGSGKWQVMPMVGARYALWEISPSSYLEPVLRYDASFAGDPTRRNISDLQIAPTLNIGLADGMSACFRVPISGSISGIRSPARPVGCFCRSISGWDANWTAVPRSRSSSACPSSRTTPSII